MSEMLESEIFLQDYLNRHRGYRLERINSKYQPLEFGGSEASKSIHPMGMAIERRVGMSFKKLFVALYPLNSSLNLHIDGKSFDLNSADILVKRDSLFPCVKRFRVIHGGNTVLSIKYIYSDLNEDGGHNIRDFFILIDGIAKDQNWKLYFSYMWKGIAQGKNSADPEFLETVDRQVAQASTRSKKPREAQ